MATTETDRFRSNLRKEQNRSAGGTRDRRRVFEDGGGGGGDSGRTSNISYSSGGATSRYTRGTHDRTESPSSGRTSTSIAKNINKLSIHDDKDDDEEEREERKEEEEQSATRRQPKKCGTGGSSSIANKINKLSINDDEVDDDKEDKEEDAPSGPRKQQKKSRGTNANSGQKRKERKNLREKRRSTGVVIMPGQPIAPGDDEEKQVQENTARNMDESVGSGSATGVCGTQMEALAKQSDQYIEELRDELAKAHRELDTLRNCNLRLKDENSALLRVVGSLSGTGTCQR